MVMPSVPRNNQEWEKLIHEFESSGLTHRQFAENRSLSLNTFRYRLYKIRRKNKSSQSDNKESPILHEEVYDSDQAQSTHTDLNSPMADLFEEEELVDKFAQIRDLLGFNEYEEDSFAALRNEWSGSDPDDTPMFDGFKDLGSLRIAISDEVNRLVGEAHMEFRRDMEEILAHDTRNFLDAFRSQILSEFRGRIQELEHAIRRLSASPEQLTKIRRRIVSAQKRGRVLQNTEFKIQMSPIELVDRLRQMKFYITEGVAREIIEKIQNRKILVLTGVPGTGKTDLARLLAEVILQDGNGPKYTKISVFPEATTWHSIGGLTMIEDRFAPHLGWVSEAALKSIESVGNHWLILDEINRGDISSLLAPALDALTPGKEGHIDHPNLFPSEFTQVGQIPLPSTFRIIGTMNPFDNDFLFEFTHALSRRTGFVRIPPLTDADELQFLETFAVERQMEAIGWPLSEITTFKDTFHIDGVLGRVILTIAHIRSLVEREPRYLFQHCEIGTALVLDIARKVCSHCADNPELTDIDRGFIVDEAIHDIFLNRLDDFSRQALEALRDEVFNSNQFPMCLRRLNGVLRGEYVDY